MVTSGLNNAYSFPSQLTDKSAYSLAFSGQNSADKFTGHFLYLHKIMHEVSCDLSPELTIRWNVNPYFLEEISKIP